MAEENVNPTSGGIGLPTGSKIGKYEIKERKAIGGQSVVYKGYDALLDRFVAIKQISTHLAEDPKFLERFRREAQILARLGTQQSAIVTIHDLIEEPAGLFIVMEYIAGHTLETVLRDTNGPTEPKAALQVIFRLAAALHDVHQAGIIHRDIKPANIIICDGLRPKITDFGVAASITGQTSMPLGTTKYMAPELFAGGEVDGRVDIYALGMVAYELLAGRPKFQEIFSEIVRDPHSEALRWMKWHGNDSVAAPALHEVNPSIPQSLSDIVAKMMAKKRDERFASMEALGRAMKLTFAKGRAASAPATGGAPIDAASRKAALERLKAMSDEGDELDVEQPPADAPPTAPIPKAAMSLRKKLTLAGAALGIVLAAAAVFIFTEISKRDAVDREASLAFKDADALYQQRQYPQAIKAFKEIAASGQYAGRPAGAKAKVMLYLARAKNLAQDPNTVDPEMWSEVITHETAAREELKKVQANQKTLLDWSRAVLREVDNFADDRTKVREFRSAMAKTRAELASGKFAEAMVTLDDMVNTIVNLTEEQKAQRDVLRQKVLHEQIGQEFAAEIARGDSLVKQDDLNGAKSAYEKALAALDRAPAGVFTDEERQANKAQAAQRMETRSTRDRYRTAIKEAETARAAGNKAEEVAALIKAQEILPSDDLKLQIKQLQSDILVDKALAYIGAKDEVAAKAHLEDALKVNPDNAKAIAKLEELQKDTQKKVLVSDGDILVTQAKYSEALAKFTAAAKLVPDDAEVTKRIVDVQFRMQLVEGDRLRDKRDYAGAAAAYEKARAIDPSRGAMIDARLQAANMAREYEDLIKKGDEFMRTSQFGKARDAYNSAKAKLDTAEVKQKIALSFYTEHMALGKEAMDQGNYASAVASFSLAKKYQEEAKVPGHEADDLLAKAESKAPK